MCVCVSVEDVGKIPAAVLPFKDELMMQLQRMRSRMMEQHTAGNDESVDAGKDDVI